MRQFKPKSQAKTLLLRVLAVSAAGLLLQAGVGRAADVQWDGGGADPNWSTANNWVGNVAPTTAGADTLIFAGSVQTIANNSFTSPVFAGVNFAAGASTFTLTGNAFSVGALGFSNLSAQTQTIQNAVTFTANATVQNIAGGSLVFAGPSMTLGNNQITFGGAGSIAISSAVSSGTSVIQKTGPGLLTATGAWTTAAGLTIHQGEFLATGSGAVLVIGGPILVASDMGDSGELSIEAAAVVQSTAGTIGSVNGATGVATVDGGDSAWTVTGSLLVGSLGNGTLNVTNSGVVSAGSMGIGQGMMAADNTGAIGIANVSGSDSILTVTGAMTVGGFGDGTLNVLGAGAVASGTSTVGASTGGTGAVIVSGGDSIWTNAGQMVVGGSGTGKVDVLTGGAVESGNTILGQNAASTGTVTVDGMDSTWQNTGTLTVGSAGTGTFNVTSGAVATTVGNAIIGGAATGVGTVAVAAEGSSWSVGGVVVGSAGTGTLTLTNGALVEVTGTLIAGSQAGSAGTVSVDGIGSTMTVSGGVTIGSLGDGDLSVLNGGTLTTGAATIASGAASTSSATIGDSGSTWNVGGNLTLGGMGAATLVVQNGGFLSVSGSINYGPGMSRIVIGGPVVAAGAGTISAGLINFGSSGNGELLFNYGGTTTFGTRLTGTGLLTHQSGITTLSGNNSGFNGQTDITGGTLYTTSSTALGTSDVDLMGAGTRLAPLGLLATGSLDWMNTSQLYMGLGTSPQASTIDLSGATTKTGTGRFVLYDDGTFQTDVIYRLIHADGGFTGYVLADLQSNTESQYYLTPTYTFSPDGLTLFVEYRSADAPTVINNGAPENTPTTANFYVVGNVTTSDAPNTVNSLTFNDNSTLTVQNTLTVTSGDHTVNVGSAQINGGTIATPNNFTKLGEGVLDTLTDFVVGNLATILNGELIVKGTMTAKEVLVRAGILTVNGTVTAPAFSVQVGALLRGSGTIIGDVVNRGTISPGNSPGTLTINGNFTQIAPGTLNIEVASLSNFDRLIVSGTASLGGTLNVTSFGGFDLEYGQQFEFLNAGAISGNFAQISVPDSSVFRGRFIANGGTGTLVIAPASYTLLAQNANQNSVAEALDGFILATSGDQRAVSVALDIMPAEDYSAAFNAIMPAFYESLPQISIEQTNAQNQMLVQRMSAVRLGVTGFNSQGINMPLTSDRDGKSVMEAKGISTVVTPADQSRWGMWVQGSGMLGEMSNVSDLPSYRFGSGAFLTGIDYRWTENFVTGLYIGYQGAYTKYSGYSTLINSALFGVYASYKRGGFYVDAIANGAYNNYQNRRPIEFSTIDRTAKSEVSGGQFSAYLGVGYDWKWGGFVIGPIASAQYVYTGLGAFNESGAESLDLRVQEENVNSFRTNLGLRMAYMWNVTDMLVITPEVRAFWQHEFLNNQRYIDASLDAGAGQSFSYLTSAVDEDSIFVGGGISVQYGPDWNGYVYYNADVGRQDYFGQMVSGGLNWKF